jgi:hypothetical protein
MAKILAVGLTIAAVLFVAEIKVHRSEPAPEASAVSALRAVASSQRAYATWNGGYARSLKALGASCAGQQQPFISPDLSTDPSVKGSYEIRLQADAHAPAAGVDCHGNPTARAYFAIAIPMKGSGTAMRAFAVDQNDVIWYDETGAAPKPPFSETAALKRLR